MGDEPAGEVLCFGEGILEEAFPVASVGVAVWRRSDAWSEGSC